MTVRSRRIDHLVLAVRDLDRAAALYGRLGFRVGARNRHPWGTANHVIQFRSSFLELITVADPERIPPHGPRSFSFGRFVQDYLSRREGLAMFVLDSVDARADAARFARQGIGDLEPFSFERSGRAADGSETHVAFTLAFAVDDRLPDAAFFVCEQHHPEAFWSTPLQRHDNGATNVSSASLQVERPGDDAAFLEAFTGVRPSADGLVYPLDEGGRLRLEPTPARTASGGSGGSGGFSGFGVAVPDLGAVARRLATEGLPFEELPDRLVVPADRCFGAELSFTRES